MASCKRKCLLNNLRGLWMHTTQPCLSPQEGTYGLKQAPRAWYERLTQFLVDNNYTRGSVDKTLFIKRDNDELFIAQIYVDDIVFGSTNNTKSNNLLMSCLMNLR
ncbi:hypothetical protein LWI29_024593 [Acer saccharum]|uniref:Reverse transcriptase Ty1/copia-type domain-containing protein n=1 Tax=Acer saccharum TaxID=4024 RepID=A0AA39SP53_ACESA|nr:hypothetical protein LWI29_024593 [Acer saccharum]